MAAHQRLRLTHGRMSSTHKGGVCQDDLRLVGEDVELDDVAVAVPVDDLRVCVGKRSRDVRMEEQKQTSANQNLNGGRAESCKGAVSNICPTAPSAPLCITLMQSC